MDKISHELCRSRLFHRLTSVMIHRERESPGPCGDIVCDRAQCHNTVWGGYQLFGGKRSVKQCQIPTELNSVLTYIVCVCVCVSSRCHLPRENDRCTLVTLQLPWRPGRYQQSQTRSRCACLLTPAPPIDTSVGTFPLTRWSALLTRSSR